MNTPSRNRLLAAALLLAIAMISAGCVQTPAPTTPTTSTPTPTQTPDIPIPTDISAEAQEILTTTTAVTVPANIPLEEVQKARAMSAEAKKPVLDALRSHMESAETEEIAGVPVLVITPTNATSADPIAIYIHGGDWIFNSAEYPIAYLFAEDLGLTVYSVDYRLAPDHPYPAPLDDCYTVYESLIKEHDPAKIVVMGDSAGGNLALATMVRAHENDLPMPAALALLSPAVDLTGGSDSLYTNDGLDPVLSQETLLTGFAIYAAGHDRTDPLLSPLYANYSADYPPTLVVTGTRDLLLSECSRIHRKMTHDGVDAELIVYEGMWHIFEGSPVPEAAVARQEIAVFLLDHLGEDTRT
ncbi:alpha/beta hydrolase [Methanofollis aquaemaris]|uniref:Alpha/beta hydrolase n=1 Tax=Methanofollis aquaemaris TaxID=126734 RepID=A0A8A3S356_9EURY|nr:alpha/beta hydrolase [Methanofollis aquaemaris]QSZ66343.1 alpha/beta hydrolase [Methanofollis aquaemaris]